MVFLSLLNNTRHTFHEEMHTQRLILIGIEQRFQPFLHGFEFAFTQLRMTVEFQGTVHLGDNVMSILFNGRNQSDARYAQVDLRGGKVQIVDATLDLGNRERKL